MNREDRSALESFRRVQEFLTQHPLADSPADLGEQAAELRSVLGELEGEMVEQESSTRYTDVHVRSHRSALEALYRDHMQPVTRLAREIFGKSGMDRAFRLPRSWSATVPLLAAATAMAGAAERERDRFTRRGLPADFVEQLRGAIAQVEQAREAKTENRRKRVDATATMRAHVRRGRSAVRQLDAILSPRLAKDAGLLAAWQSAKRVRPTAAAGPDDELPPAEGLKVA